VRIAVITLFPEMLGAVTDYGVNRRALDSGQVEIRAFNPRDFAQDKHRTVDDRPYGGGPGMVMRIEPLVAALAAAQAWQQEIAAQPGRVVYLSPQGKTLEQAAVKEYCRCSGLILVAGRYEGIDERFIELYVDEELSIGDYVLSGGELPAMVLLDAIMRLQPGVLGDANSSSQDSFEYGLLDCPHYTRPEVFDGHPVPEALMSGDHKRIAEWRLRQSLGRTQLRRPDLLRNLELNQTENALLDEYRRGLHPNVKQSS
jgi:tRNA (guanine37-N1)-methyltransferase